MMAKIKKLFKAFAEIIKEPALLNKIIDDNGVWKNRVEAEFGLKNGFPVLSLDELFTDFKVSLNSFSFTGGGSLPTDIALLKKLCESKNDCTYFEIGTWRGESVRNVSEVSKECFTLNLSNQEMIEIFGSEEYASAHFFFSKGIENVTQLYGDSKKFDFAALNKKFDVVFIDGNHHHDYIKSDTQNVFQFLTDDNTIVVWHDYAYNPESLRYETMHAILEAVPEELHKHLYFVANTMCAIFIKGNFKTHEFNPLSDPEVTYKVEICSKKI